MSDNKVDKPPTFKHKVFTVKGNPFKVSSSVSVPPKTSVFMSPSMKKVYDELLAMDQAANKPLYTLDEEGLVTQPEPASPVLPYVSPKPRTQKAKGLYKLSNVWSHIWAQTLTVKALIQSADAIDHVVKHLPAFCRPCPVRPRHGFVESRVVETKDELAALLAETLAADPNGEVMLTPVFPHVRLNAVVTPHSVVLGAGHDGATAGKDTLTIPLAGLVDPSLKGELGAAGVGENEDPYIEVIYPVGSTPILTQLRAGPKGAVVGDFIPGEVVVSEVIVPAGEDLLAWEKRLQQAGTGTVVYHPGGSATDHYAAHARTFNIPVVFSHEPKIGDTLVGQPPPPMDPGALLRGAKAAFEIDMTNLAPAKHLAAIMILGAHFNHVMTGDATFWVGVSVGAMIRLGIAAMKGEARHLQAWDGGCSHDRTANWLQSWKDPIDKLPNDLVLLTQVHEYGPWHSRGFGGRKWAQCGIALFPLVRDLKLLALTAPTDPKAIQIMNRLVRNLNIAINQAHNGGWWMNKFIGGDAFTNIQKGSMNYLWSALPMCWTLKRDLNPTEDLAYKTFAGWSVPHMRAVDLDTIEIEQVPLLNTCVLRIKSPIFSKSKTITLTIPARLRSIVVNEGLYAKQVRGRWTLFTAETNKRVWVEKPLKPQTTNED